VSDGGGQNAVCIGNEFFKKIDGKWQSYVFSISTFTGCSLLIGRLFKWLQSPNIRSRKGAKVFWFVAVSGGSSWAFWSILGVNRHSLSHFIFSRLDPRRISLAVCQLTVRTIKWQPIRQKSTYGAADSSDGDKRSLHFTHSSTPANICILKLRGPKQTGEEGN
jgi:hypothetical protein